MNSGYKVHISNRVVCLTLGNGAFVSFPVASSPRLTRGSEAELQDIELSPFGIHWPALDEDLSFEGIMRGDYGQR